MQKNLDFLFGRLMQLTQERYKMQTGFECPTLEKLLNDFGGASKGKEGVNKNVYKYSSNEYL